MFFGCEFCYFLGHLLSSKYPVRGAIASTPAKAPPLTRIIHFPLCTADLSPQTRVRAFFLYVEGGGLIFLMPRLATTIKEVGSFDLTAHGGPRESPV
jgi:hypothetical protein